ncbi:MAG: competence/damage-inducible protein A [Desulfitobacterium sp.]
MKAEIVATGTEILLGQTLNTSAHYLTGKLSELGIEVDYHTTVGDNKERLAKVIIQGIERSDLLLITGGTGPTEDDLSKELIAQVFGLKMLLDPASLKSIQEFFVQRGTEMPETERKQAYFPEGSQVLPNHQGTAPGAILQKGNKTIILLPGPPSEMEPMFKEYVWPFLEQKAQGDMARMYVRIIKVVGLGESDLEERLQDFVGKKNPSITLLCKPTEMHIRIVVRGNAAEALEVLDQTELIIRERLGEQVFGTDEDTMLGLVSEGLKKQQLTLSTAESCTGGALGALLTEQPGSSDFYLGGVISYSNAMKENFLGVSAQTLAQFGAVSAETAREMAAGVRERTKADLGISITGIAGPGGGSQDKPVGLVYIGLATSEGIKANMFQFHGGRDSIRQLSVQAALNWIRSYLLKIERG